MQVLNTFFFYIYHQTLHAWRSVLTPSGTCQKLAVIIHIYMQAFVDANRLAHVRTMHAGSIRWTHTHTHAHRHTLIRHVIWYWPYWQHTRSCAAACVLQVIRRIAYLGKPWSIHAFTYPPIERNHYGERRGEWNISIRGALVKFHVYFYLTRECNLNEIIMHVHATALSRLSNAWLDVVHLFSVISPELRKRNPVACHRSGSLRGLRAGRQSSEIPPDFRIDGHELKALQ
jgi:hypothetical protein